MSIPTNSNAVIPQHQRQQNLYQEILPSLMSLKLDLSLQGQYSNGSPPASIMSLRSVFHHSSSSKSNNSRTKFWSKKRIYNRSKYNPKYNYRIDRRESRRRRQTCESTAKSTNDTATNVTATSTAQKVPSRREECETMITDDTYPFDIDITAGIEMMEL